jgi:hypothetical protein
MFGKIFRKARFFDLSFCGAPKEDQRRPAIVKLPSAGIVCVVTMAIWRSPYG